MKLFISYSRDDKAWVFELWRALRDEAGHDAWLDQRVVPAQNWWDTILDNLEAATCIIYVMTPKSIESIYCQAELAHALALNKPVLPLMLKACDLPSSLSERQIQYQLVSDDMNLDRVLFKIEQGLSAVQLAFRDGKYAQQNVQRPTVPRPQRKPEQISEVFMLAEEAVSENNLSLAEALFQQVIDADPKDWGRAATERLGEIHFERGRDQDYRSLLQMANNPAMRRGARAAARVFIQKYGEDYDPSLVLTDLVPPVPNPPPIIVPPEPESRQNVEDMPPLAEREPESVLQSVQPVHKEQATEPVRASEAHQPIKQKRLRILGSPTIVIAIAIVLIGGLLLARSGSSGDTSSFVQLNGTSYPIGTANKQWTPKTQVFNGVEMVEVPPGCFMMGTDNPPSGYGNENPANKVCFSAPFYIDKTEVTQAQLEQLKGAAANKPYFAGSQRPVEDITWAEARDFCAKRGARLPTEAEWEYAARGPDDLIYPWGNQWDSSKAVWNRSSGEETANVGSIPAGVSWVGALDMSGNVWEWTSSLYKPYPYRADDGRESNTDIISERVLRGGSWDSDLTDILRASVRLRDSPTLRYGGLGVRCARSF